MMLISKQDKNKTVIPKMIDQAPGVLFVKMGFAGRGIIREEDLNGRGLIKVCKNLMC